MKIGKKDVDIDANQLITDLTAKHADGTKLSMWEKIKLLIKHNPMVLVAIIYSISPIDLIPDPIPIAGSIDDTMILLGTMLKLFQQVLDARSGAAVSNGQVVVPSKQAYNVTGSSSNITDTVPIPDDKDAQHL